MRKVIVVLLLVIGFLFCFNSGYTVSENQNAAEIHDLLESNLRLETIVNVYQHNYGPLTEKDAELYLRKKNRASLGYHNGRIGPI